jgi:geranylgeranyl diphosphate synthase type I
VVSTPSAATAESVLDPQSPLSQAFREAISAELSSFLAEQATVLESMGPELVPVQLMASQLLRGGKRLRPAFCVWGYVAAAGRPDDIELHSLLTAAASLDVLHGSALVHDDVMDASDLRRGRPAAHRQFEALHANAAWLGDSEAFGKAGAIILGDLLVMWSAQMLHAAGLDRTALERALPIVEAMRTEVTCGQYLDIVAQAHPLRQRAPAIDSVRPSIELALDDASRVVEYKAARYTVQRPAQMGAALGGGDDELYYALGAYGSPLGRAFQFRDDLLGVFGDPQLTGKPSGDDLREGKRTVLIAHAYAHAGPAGQKLLVQRLGDPNLTAEGVADLQQLIVESGAQQAVERMITEGYERAVRALQDAEVTDEGRIGLTGLAGAAVRRDM